jgi:hypothetical protein
MIPHDDPVQYFYNSWTIIILCLIKPFLYGSDWNRVTGEVLHMPPLRRALRDRSGVGRGA